MPENEAIKADAVTLARIFDCLPCVALVIETDTRTVVECNKHSRDAGAGVGRKCHETVFKLNAPCGWCQLPAMIHTNKEQRSVVHSGGRIYDISWIPLSDGRYLHFAFDVTEHKKLEQVIVESEEKFAKTFKNNIVGMAVANLDNFKFIEANEAFTELLGYPVDQIIGRTPIELNLFKRREDAMNLANMLEEGIDITHVHLDITTKSGEICTALFSASCVTIGGKPSVLFSVVDRTKHAQSENSLRQSEKTLRLLSRKLISLQEEERAGISSVLHDDLGQTLTALALELELILNSTTENKDDIEKVFKYTTGAIARLREICASLRPHTLDDIGLFSALNLLIEKFTGATRIPVHTHMEKGESCEQCRIVHLPIYRIAQEALSNIEKHADAAQVTVTFHRGTDGSGCALRITDDGKGFNTEEPRAGFGIIAMKERAATCGGSLDIQSEPGKGTQVKLTIHCDSVEHGGGGI